MNLAMNFRSSQDRIQNCLFTECIPLHSQEYPSDTLRKISALQTKVELAGNLSNKQSLAENLAYRALASSVERVWLYNPFWLGITFRMRSLRYTVK